MTNHYEIDKIKSILEGIEDTDAMMDFAVNAADVIYSLDDNSVSPFAAAKKLLADLLEDEGQSDEEKLRVLLSLALADVQEWAKTVREPSPAVASSRV